MIFRQSFVETAVFSGRSVDFLLIGRRSKTNLGSKAGGSIPYVTVNQRVSFFMPKAAIAPAACRSYCQSSSCQTEIGIATCLSMDICNMIHGRSTKPNSAHSQSVYTRTRDARDGIALSYFRQQSILASILGDAFLYKMPYNVDL